MVLIPAGLFTMGAVIDDGETNEEPVHVVAVSGFYMDTTEVTKTKWDEVHTWATNHGYSFWCDIVGAAHGTGAQAEGPDHPVYLVDWYDCVKWANARSEMEGLTPCYSLDGVVYRTDSFDHLFDIYDPACDWNANGYRLPTEAEWEKAGRGGAENSRFPWGDTNTIQHARANYTSSALYTYDTSPTRGAHPDYDDPAKALNTSPVGAFAPNGYGLYDMAGNVEEWCWDWYAPGYYGVSPQSDPRGAALAEVEFGPGYGCRITRGGACVGRGGIDCRVAARFWTGPGTAVSIGFRLVRRVP
jgi:formylglycine-generating enzyme required for sulfatase activity